MTSYAPEVKTVNDPEWYGNGLRFKTMSEAQMWVLDLSTRWTAVTDTRVVPSEDEANR